MSEQEQHAALGKVVEEYAAATKALTGKSEELKKLSKRLGGLSSALSINQDGSIADLRTANTILSELPADLTPAGIRATIDEYSKLKATVDGCKSQLKPYGLG